MTTTTHPTRPPVCPSWCNDHVYGSGPPEDSWCRRTIVAVPGRPTSHMTPIEVVVADDVHPGNPTVFMYGHHEDNPMTSEDANLLARRSS